MPKYTLPTAAYESRSDSVLAWKRAQKLGRFDPAAPEKLASAAAAHEADAVLRRLGVGRRCRVGGEGEFVFYSDSRHHWWLYWACSLHCPVGR